MTAPPAAKGLQLTVESTPRCVVRGDTERLQQVVWNLLSNAIKFTPQSGKVALLVNRSSDGGQLVSVRDNGPGIPEDEIETVLSSFGQGSLAQKTAEQGAGLGLPIVQKIMELHQGRFDLFSKRNIGGVLEERGIEVKGRVGVGEIELTENEWARACNLRDKYWPQKAKA